MKKFLYNGTEGQSFVPLNHVRLWKNNPRKNEGAVKRLASLIKKHGQKSPIVVCNKTGVIYKGNTTFKAIKSLKWKRIKVEFVTFPSKSSAIAYALADNKSSEFSQWDDEILRRLMDSEELTLDMQTTGFTEKELLAITKTPENIKEEARKTLAERFIIPPFSLLDARQGYWQDRKKAWIKIGVAGQLGRAENLLDMSGTIAGVSDKDREEFNAERRNRKKMKKTLYGEGVVEGNLDEFRQRSKEVKVDPRSYNVKSWVKDSKGEDFKGLAGGVSEVSVFDPVLCEVVYRWFCPRDGKILDPFAGGVTRGFVAGWLGYSYTGIEVREEQFNSNIETIHNKDFDCVPQWKLGDSHKMGKLVSKSEKFDLVFTSPPYYDLEIYSDEDSDMSNFATYNIFMGWYSEIFKKAVRRLEQNRFLVVVVGEIRDEKGKYRNFIGDNISLFTDLGLLYYNEIILVTMHGSLPIRVGKQFETNRKIGKTHQNVLVFYKGDIKAIKENFDKEVQYGTDIKEQAQED